MVVTGSHNWTYSADHINDENTLIIHDQSFTNIFRQEFEARWKELVPSATLENGIASISIYPNPAQSGFYFQNRLDEMVELTMFNANGSALQQFKVAANDTGACHWSPNLSGGTYIIKATWPDHQVVTRLMILPN